MKQAIFDWSELAFGSKKPIKKLQATFIMAPRTLSSARLTQLLKTYLQKGNVVLGIAEEPFVLGFEGQPQFTMLQHKDVKLLQQKIQASKIAHQLYLLRYSQRTLTYILEQLDFRQVVLVNGSWKHSFHTLPVFYSLVSKQIPYEFVSPFTDEQEAKAYVRQTNRAIQKSLHLHQVGKFYHQEDMIKFAQQAARQSYDNAGQTGVSLGKKRGTNYRLLATGFNEVVPYQTFALHFGASREQHFTPPNDLNHYDTVHAEIQVIMHLLRAGENITGTSMFVTVLPCPVCARILIKSGVQEIIYTHDHSDGYAVNMLTKAGVEVRRLVL